MSAATIPGYVRGIVSLEPPQIQCEGCDDIATGQTLPMLVLTCGITFDPMSDDKRRLCRNCRP